MNNTDLKESVVNKIINDKKNCIFINGAWGIGKTFCWNQIKAELKLQDKKIIYVSLFGIENLNELKEKIKIQIAIENGIISNNFLANTEKRKALELATKKTLKLINININNLSLTKLLPLKLNEKFVICFDDFERLTKEISIVALLGFIEEISNLTSIIVIGNIDELNDKGLKIYKNFKEKVIDFEFTLDIIDSLTLSNIAEQFDLVYAYRNIFEECFNHFESNNLRIFIKALYFCNKLALDINNEFSQDIDRDLIFLLNQIIYNDLIKEEDEEKDTKEEDGVFSIPKAMNDNDYLSSFKPSTYSLELKPSLKKFYEHNFEIKNQLHDYFKKKKHSLKYKEINNHLRTLKDYIFYSEKKIIENIYTLLKIITSKRFLVFSSIYDVTELYKDIIVLESEYLSVFIPDESEIEKLFLDAIRFQLINNHLIDKSHFFSYDYDILPDDISEHAKNKIRRFSKYIEEIFRESYVKEQNDILKELFLENKFVEMKNILNKMDTVELDLSLFDSLISDSMDKEYWRFFHSVCKKRFNMTDEFKSQFSNKILELSQLTTDKTRKKILLDRIKQYNL